MTHYCDSAAHDDAGNQAEATRFYIAEGKIPFTRCEEHAITYMFVKVVSLDEYEAAIALIL